MAVDKSYGSGNKNTGMKKPVAPKAASAKLRRKGGNVAAKKYTSITTSKAKMLPGTSDYVTQENAARKQLGVAGLAARTRQLPTAARAFTKEMTGIDISRKGVKVDPFSVAMALPVGKVLKAAKALRAAGNIARADSLTARVVAKAAGGSRAAARGQREQKVVAFMRPDYPGVFQGPVDSVRVGSKARGLSESLFPRGTDLAKRALKAKAEQRTAIKESMNYQFPFNRVINESERIERKYGLTQRTAEEGLKQAAKRIKPRKTGGR